MINIADWIKGVAKLKYNRDENRYEYFIRDYRVGVETRRIIARKVEYLNRVLDDVTGAYAQQFFLMIFRGIAGSGIAFILEKDMMGDLLPWHVPFASSFAIILFWLCYYVLKEWRLNRYFKRTVLKARDDIIYVMLRERKRRSAKAAAAAVVARSVAKTAVWTADKPTKDQNSA